MAKIEDLNQAAKESLDRAQDAVLDALGPLQWADHGARRSVFSELASGVSCHKSVDRTDILRLRELVAALSAYEDIRSIHGVED